MWSYDVEEPEVFRDYIVKRSRKSHTCCECGKSIPSGSSYHRVEGIWPGSGPETFKTCLSCHELRSLVIQHEIESGYCRYGYTPPFGELFETAVEAGALCLLPNRRALM